MVLSNAICVQNKITRRQTMFREKAFPVLNLDLEFDFKIELFEYYVC